MTTLSRDSPLRRNIMQKSMAVPATMSTRSDAIPLTTARRRNAPAELEVSQAKSGSRSFVLKGLLTATGTGHTVDANGHIYNPAGETVMLQQRITVENAVGHADI